MRKLFYMGLESYNDRYTLQLTHWNKIVFDRRKFDVIYVPGETLNNSQKISVGQVLDAHGRSYFSMSQMMNLVKMMQSGEVNNQDVIYFEDMFQPGMESLPYILNQVPKESIPRIYVRCLAQSIDPDDFIHVCGMQKWMGLYEKMINEFVTGVLATSEEMVANMKIAGWTAPIYNISGLAFGKDEVISRIGGIENIKPFNKRPMRVAFSSRFDQEKQPGFYMDVAESFDETVEFCIFQGDVLRSNDSRYIDRARKLEKSGKLTIYENLKKNDYYELLNNTRVLFNCALQDWVSNTVSEADALGANVLFPAYRSFPETFNNDYTRLYVPWSFTDAVGKLDNLLLTASSNQGKISDWNDSTIDRICDIFLGKGEHMLRMNNKYRNYISKGLQ